MSSQWKYCNECQRTKKECDAEGTCEGHHTREYERKMYDYELGVLDR